MAFASSTSPSERAVRMRVDDTAPSPEVTYLDTFTGIPYFFSICGVPTPPAPKRQFAPHCTFLSSGNSHLRNAMNSSGGIEANFLVNLTAWTVRETFAPAVLSKEMRSLAVMSNGGAADGQITESGWFWNVSTASAPASILLCPKCTPSKKPTASVTKESCSLGLRSKRDLPDASP